ncbi:MAG: hypothetical protein IJ125_06795 [Atopobiaceae bacterium]|nr:hypothetical protein [Atopobiaceae bacterium]
MAKREHLNDYVASDDGGYTYVGVRWSWPSSEARAGFLKIAWMCVAVALLGIVVAGFVPAPGSLGAFYVVIPYAASVVGAVLCVIALIQLTGEAQPMRDHIYQKSGAMLPAKLFFAGASAAFAALAAVVHAMVFLSALDMLSVFFALALLISSVSLFVVRSRVRKLTFVPDKAQ